MNYLFISRECLRHFGNMAVLSMVALLNECRDKLDHIIIIIALF